ncbi:MAG TPA: ABC transporter permease, partial [Conexibacter sp.]|nr:ABC transporter permease [Conexibacter sp.]
LGPYVRELWRRREFAREMARTNLRAQHFNTVFGQLWLVLNPLMLAAVYFLLVYILRSGSRGVDFFAHLLAGLFAYYFISDSIRLSVKSVTGGGRLILNTAFPRALLPLSGVITAFMRFLPTLIVYIPVHIIAGLPFGPSLLWVVPLIFLMFVMASGAAMLVSALQVYFRDVKNFLPYFLRIWLYASPVLYYASEVPDGIRWILVVNPLGGLLTAWSDVIILGHAPEADALALAAAWAFGIFVVGAGFFISREREFAVRL